MQIHSNEGLPLSPICHSLKKPTATLRLRSRRLFQPTTLCYDHPVLMSQHSLHKINEGNAEGWWQWRRPGGGRGGRAIAGSNSRFCRRVFPLPASPTTLPPPPPRQTRLIMISSRQSLSLFYFSVSSLPFCAVFVLFFFFHFVRILFLSISLLIISVSPFVLCSGRLRPHLAKHHRRHRQLSSWRRMRPPPLRRPRPQRRLSIKSAPLCLCPRNRHRSPPHQLPRSPRSLLSLRLAPVD